MSAARKIDARMEVLLNEFYAEAFEKGRQEGVKLAFGSAKATAHHCIECFKDRHLFEKFYQCLNAAELTYRK